MHIFHKWGKWERKQETWVATYTGLLCPPELKGKTVDVTRIIQERKCEICNKTQREELDK